MELRWTRRLQRALEMVRIRERDQVIGESRLPLEAAKVALAEALLEALAADDRLARVPTAPPARVVQLPRPRARKKA